MANKTNKQTNRPKSNPPKAGTTLKRRPYDKGGKIK